MNSILLSDDSRSIRQILTTTLRSSGYEVIDVENGQDAARVARDRDFDLILTDLNMPLLDGIGLTRELRTMPRHSQTPIIIVTTESQLAKKEKAKEAGANGWIVKPIQPPRLVQVVEQILAKTAGVR